MSDGTKIEWTDATWNPVTGCTKISEGCTHCYIARTPPFRMAGRRFEHPEGPDRIGATTGVQLHPERLGVPVAWRKPRRIFVCSLADLFHAAVPELHIAKVFAAMHLAPQHTFQVLTKRSGRMRSLLSSHDFRLAVEACARTQAPRATPANAPLPWPLPNVWVGVSAETQRWADIRVPDLLRTPAAVRWVSAEPLLGPLDLSPWLDPVAACEQCDVVCPGCPFGKAVICSEDYRMWADGKPLDEQDVDAAFAAGQNVTDHQPIRHLDWVVAGGESGPGARPMHPDWARGLRDQCAEAGVAFLFKQWGEFAPTGRSKGVIPGEIHVGEPDPDGFFANMRKVGKKAAGRVLDGRTHDDYPADRAEMEDHRG